MSCSRVCFYFMCRGDSGATQLFDCSSLAEARAEARRFLGVSRLPRGTEVWRSAPWW